MFILTSQKKVLSFILRSPVILLDFIIDCPMMVIFVLDQRHSIHLMSYALILSLLYVNLAVGDDIIIPECKKVHFSEPAGKAQL